MVSVAVPLNRKPSAAAALEAKDSPRSVRAASTVTVRPAAVSASKSTYASDGADVNRGSPHDWRLPIDVFDPPTHVARVVPAGTHDWHRFLTPQELAMLATDCGMEMVLAAGMVPDLRAGVAALRGVGRGRGSATNALLSTWRLSASDLRINYIALMQQQRK